MKTKAKCTILMSAGETRRQCPGEGVVKASLDRVPGEWKWKLCTVLHSPREHVDHTDDAGRTCARRALLVAGNTTQRDPPWPCSRRGGVWDGYQGEFEGEREHYACGCQETEK